MKIHRSHRPSKKLIIISLLSVAIVVVAGLSVYAFFGSASNKDDIVTPVKEDGRDAVEIQDRPIGDVDDSAPTEDEANPAIDTPQTEPEANPNGDIPVSITYADGTPLQVRMVINEILSSGTCRLSLQRDGQQPVIRSVETFVATTYTTCKGFTVDTTRLAKGTWNATLTITSGNRTGSVSREVTVR